MTQAQLETLQTENRHLKGLLQRLESQSPKVCLLWHSCDVVITVLQTAADRVLFLTWLQWLISLCFLPPGSLRSAQRGDPSLASLRESYVSSLSNLEQENRQLRQALARLEVSSRTCQDKYEQALLSHAMTDQPQPAQERYLVCTDTHNITKDQETEPKSIFCSVFTRRHKHKEEAQTATRSEGEIQKLFEQLHTLSRSPGEHSCGQAPDSGAHSTASSSTSSNGSARLNRRNSVPSTDDSAADGRSCSSEDSLPLMSKETIIPSPSPVVRLITNCNPSPQLCYRLCSSAVCFPSLPGAFLNVTCRRHGFSFPGGRGPEVHGAAPQIGHLHPGYEWEQHKDSVKVPSKRLGGLSLLRRQHRLVSERVRWDKSALDSTAKDCLVLRALSSTI